MSNVLWVDKYQPKSFQEYIIEDSIKETLENYVSNGDIPHLLLEGSFGLGKTTLAKLLCSKLNAQEFYINASIDTSIDNIREKVMDFCSRKSQKNIKIVIFDEADGLSLVAQDGLKAFIEKYQSSGVRFIFTTNHIEKIGDGIISRCNILKFEKPELNSLIRRLVDILNQEEIELPKSKKYPDKPNVINIAKIIKDADFDIRQSIVHLQNCCLTGEFIYKENEFKFLIKELINLLTENNNPDATYQQVKQLLANSNVKNYERLYSELFEKIDLWVKEGQYCATTILLNTYSYQSKPSHDKELNFMAFISELLI